MRSGNFFHENSLSGPQIQREPLLWAIILALTGHVLAFGGGIFFSQLIPSKRLIEETVMVDLVSLPDLPSQVHSSSPKPKPTRQVEPVSQPPVSPLEKEPEMVSPVAIAPLEQRQEKAQPLSLRPRKTKVVKVNRQKFLQEQEIKNKQERQRKAAQEEADRLAKEMKKRAAEEKARLQAQQRREEQLALAREQQRKALAASLKAQYELDALRRESLEEQRSQVGTGRGRSQSTVSVMQKQYLARLFQRVRSYWVLPEMRTWSSSLEAVVVITVKRNGTIVDTVFEKHSSDPQFDQLVRQTLIKAAPMPVFSAVMNINTLEVGLRFRPGAVN